MGKAAVTGEGDIPLLGVGLGHEAGGRLAPGGRGGDAPRQARRLTPDELLLLFEALRAEEAGHLTRLRRMQHGLQADRPVAVNWLRAICRSRPAEYRG